MKNIFKKEIQVSEWWKNALASTFGTILGIILTVGVSYWQHIKEQKDMTRKIAKITLHNIDVRISTLQRQCEELAVKDSIFGLLQKVMPGGLDKISDDSLQIYIQALSKANVSMTDTKSENIFSNSFQVWQYLEDEKVIGRISNCFSVIDMSEKVLFDLEQSLQKLHNRIETEVFEKNTFFDNKKFLTLYLSDPEIKATYLRILYAYMIYNSLDDIQDLNDINKRVLGISQKELDELSNLNEDNTKSIHYTLHNDSIEMEKDSIEN